MLCRTRVVKPPVFRYAVIVITRIRVTIKRLRLFSGFGFRIGIILSIPFFRFLRIRFRILRIRRRTLKVLKAFFIRRAFSVLSVIFLRFRTLFRVKGFRTVSFRIKRRVSYFRIKASFRFVENIVN